MKRLVSLSLVAVASLYAAEAQLDTIGVESSKITEVAQNAQTSADLAQAISANVASIDMNRRSGIANDIYIRGQKRDNIAIEVDGTKVYGACPNRMDPPVSHILANQIDEVEVTEGPFDVTTFGNLVGGVKVTTKKPKKELYGELNLGYGAWDYKKVGATVSGGNDTVRVLVSASTESSEQYEDGDGRTIAGQIDKAIADGKAMAGNALQAKYKDMDAYEKKSIMAKTFVNVTDNQELQLSLTANRSDDIIYGNSQMDADYDDSNIYSIAYNISNINDTFQNVNLQYYASNVDHPMSTKFRNAGAMMYMTNQLETSMKGFKLKNDLSLIGHKILFGLDSSKRTWEGVRFMTTVATGARGMTSTSLTPTETKNNALFVKLDKSVNDFDISMGARYDATDITPTTGISKDYNSLSANVLATYNLCADKKLFAGIGQAYRVPDARELYMTSVANPNLNHTRNRELDLGYELNNETMNFKVKGFYSLLSDYMYYNATSTKFENVDATVYGAELTASYFASDDISIDSGISYKRGTKDNALAGQTDKDMADMAPLKGNVALNYEYMNNSLATLEVQASDEWDTIDSDNGEQRIGAWAIVNLKAKHTVNKHVELTLGVNNLFDETYTQSNTYKDLVLLTAGNSDVMLLNEPGRYLYTNLTVKY